MIGHDRLTRSIVTSPGLVVHLVTRVRDSIGCRAPIERLIKVIVIELGREEEKLIEGGGLKEGVYYVFRLVEVTLRSSDKFIL